MTNSNVTLLFILVLSLMMTSLNAQRVVTGFEMTIAAFMAPMLMFQAQHRAVSMYGAGHSTQGRQPKR